MKTIYIAAILTITVLCLLIVGCSVVIPTTQEELKMFLAQPLSLLVLMILGAFGSMLKQLGVARRQGTPQTALDYLLRIETIITLGQTFGLWLVLLFTDSLNMFSAVLGGYAANDAADAWTKEGRSAAITSTTTTKDNP